MPFAATKQPHQCSWSSRETIRLRSNRTAGARWALQQAQASLGQASARLRTADPDQGAPPILACLIPQSELPAGLGQATAAEAIGANPGSKAVFCFALSRF